ncbi:MAG: cation diffusion facilitator family transporter [Pseudomonadota bacterium]
MNDHDHQGHAHGGAGHSHAPASFGRAFALGIGLNITFVAIEAAFGFWSNSVALLADAGHNLSDVLGLIVAWIATMLAARAPTARYTYGLRGSSILAALFNAMFLLVAIGGIAWEAILRIQKPEPVASLTVMAVASVGILINGFTAWLFASGRKGDLNIRGAYLHMAADAGVSAAVLLAGLGIMLTGWLWLDPVVSLVLVVVIFWSTWGLLRDSVSMSLAAVPVGVDIEAVKAYLQALPGVSTFHDLHIWSMSTTETALTVHLVMPEGHPGDAFLMKVQDELHEHHSVEHPTIQIETSLESACKLAPEGVV